MNLETPEASDQAAITQARQGIRLMSYAAAALAVLGVVILFLPWRNRSHFMEICGALVIVGGAFTLGFAQYMRRRLR
jgi:drug/metabolite transporter (DMT)-like permease